MSDYHVIIGAASVCFGLVGFALYILSIVRGITKPHLFTWFTFGLLDATVVVAQLMHGAGPGAWALTLSVAECSAIAALAVRWGEKRITTFDRVSFIAALIGIVLWSLTSQPLIAIGIACAVNALGFAPTFRKAFVRPYQESITLWTMDIFRFGLSLIALESFTVTTAIFPATIVLGNAAFVALVLFRRKTVTA